MNRDFSTNGIAPYAMPLKTVVMCSCALAAIALGTPAAGATKPRVENASIGAPSGPLVAVVSLSAQRLSVYDKNGQVLTSRVSSGRVGYETPQGVFAIIERNREYFSNLYEDAPMPNMQRITWSGVAMYAGGLPGYPASHGCIRLPMEVSDRLFELIKLGTRVVVTDGIAVPIAFEHAGLFNLRTAEPAGSVGVSVAPIAKSLLGAMSLPMMLGAVVATPVQASAPTSLSPAAPDVFADRPADVSRAAWATELPGRAQMADGFARSAKTSAATAQKQADRTMQQVLVSALMFSQRSKQMSPRSRFSGQPSLRLETRRVKCLCRARAARKIKRWRLPLRPSRLLRRSIGWASRKTCVNASARC